MYDNEDGKIQSQLIDLISISAIIERSQLNELSHVYFQFTMTKKIKKLPMSFGKKLVGSSSTHISTTRVSCDSNLTVSMNLFKCQYKALSPSHQQSSYRRKHNIHRVKLKIQ